MPLRDHAGKTLKGGSAVESALAPSVLIVIGIVAVLLTVGGFLYYKGKSLRVPVDEQTLCPKKQPVSRVVVILLDASDRMSEPQRIQLQNLLTRVRDGLPRFALLEVYGLDRFASNVPQPTLHLCNPGTGDDMNRVYQNPDLARKKWQSFASVVENQIDRQLAMGEQPTSPIFEAVQAIAIRTFGKPEYDSVDKDLVIVSDLMQNVPGSLVMYDTVPSFGSFRSSAYYSSVRSDLHDVHVFAIYLDRHLGAQGRPHVQFWDSYLSAQGAALDSVQRVYGEK